MSARIRLDPATVVGPVRRRTFGSFVEHLGRCVYTGIYEPDHPSATPEGFRGDVLDLVRELGVTLVRYPGGNFVSGYRWRDGVGPVAERPARLDLAWHSLEPNLVGVDELMAWARHAGVEVNMAVNLGTAGVLDAVDLLDYCNTREGTDNAARRRAHGAAEPYGIRLWCLGNEMDGPWQIGHTTARDYGRLANRTAAAMRMVDPDLELVACGSSGHEMPTFGEWERTVLDEAWPNVDLVSMHAYYSQREPMTLQEYLVCADGMAAFIDDMVDVVDGVAAARHSDKVVGLAFDEWNVWYMHRAESQPPTGDDWPVAPRLLEDRYSVADAVVVGDLLGTLLRRTDRVWSANLAQLVNVIAPIMTEPGGAAWRQTTFHPFALTARHAAGDVVRAEVDGPEVTGPDGATAAVTATATWADATGEGAVFLVNRSVPATVPITLEPPPGAHLVEAVTMHHDDPGFQVLGPADEDVVVPRPNPTATDGDGAIRLEVPPVSWSMVRLAR